MALKSTSPLTLTISRVSGENLGHRRRRSTENGYGHTNGDRPGHQRQRSEASPRLPTGVARARARQKSRRSLSYRRRRPLQEQRAAIHVQDGSERGRRDQSVVQSRTRSKYL